MSLLIPQAALDSLVCDFCYKYLSVTPIKVFPNRRIKCGRCVSQDDDNGVISLYDKVAKRSSFKCINHYQGCKALLNTTEVLQHEAACKSKLFFCPACDDSIPSYHLYNHFINKHEELVLKKTYFIVKQSDYTNLHFLYRYKNYLLFVKYSNEILLDDNLTKILINFSVIGDSKSVRTLKVDTVLTLGKTIIERKVNCDVFPSDDGNDLKLNLDLTENNLLVGFSLEVPESDFSIINVPIEENLPSNYILLTYYFKNREIYLDPTVDKKLGGIFILRKYGGSENKNDAGIAKIEVSTNQMSSIVLTCFVCSLTNFYYVKGEILFIKKSDKYYFICHFCEKSIKQTVKGFDFYVGACFLGNVTYFCKWMCGSHVPYYDLHRHENDCKNQISQPCPVGSCEHRCKSFEIKQHFKDKHPQLPTPVFHFDDNFLSDSCGQVIYYVVSNISIVIEIDCDTYDGDFYVTLTSNILNASPRMVILDRDNQFVKLVQENRDYFFSEDVSGYKYMCYLAYPAK